MKNENSSSAILGWLDAVLLIASAAVAAGYAVTKTPPAFWISAWAIQAIAFVVVVAKRRNRSHWASTVFGLVELAYIFALLAMLSSRGASFDSLAQLFFGLLFVHGILYLVAAKPYLSGRGTVNPTASGPSHANQTLGGRK